MGPKPAAVFISDAHLGLPVPGQEDREERLLRFLDSLRGTATHLFLLGDMFDFWIEYNKLVRADYVPTLIALKNLADNGTEIHVFSGNHDFALQHFFPRVLGFQVHDTLDIEIHGRKIHMRHGDGLLAADTGYRVLRAILRSPLNQWLYKCIHPVLGIYIAERCSRMSRRLTGLHILEERIISEYRSAAKRLMADHHADTVVLGHTHLPEIRSDGQTVYCNTGDWMRKFSFARIENGKMSLWESLPDNSCRPIEMQAW